MDEMRTPSHGRGKLLVGGKKGHKGGPGRPPNAIKADCRRGFANLLETLLSIASGETQGNSKPSFSDRLKAMNMLAKYGFDEQDVILPHELADAAAKVFAEQIVPERLTQALQSLVKQLEEGPEPIRS